MQTKQKRENLQKDSSDSTESGDKVHYHEVVPTSRNDDSKATLHKNAPLAMMSFSFFYWIFGLPRIDLSSLAMIKFEADSNNSRNDDSLALCDSSYRHCEGVKRPKQSILRLFIDLQV